MEIFHSIWTVALFIIFLGIIVWAFSGHRKRAFDEAARLPLEDDPYDHVPGQMDQSTGETRHG